MRLKPEGRPRKIPIEGGKETPKDFRSKGNIANATAQRTLNGGELRALQANHGGGNSHQIAVEGGY